MLLYHQHLTRVYGIRNVPRLSTNLSFTCSGYGIAAQALTAVIRAHDGRGPQTTLTHIILDTLNLSSPDELIGYASNSQIISHSSLYFQLTAV